MVLFRSVSLILDKPPKTLITIANNNVILVKVRLHPLNELLRIPFERTERLFPRCIALPGNGFVYLETGMAPGGVGWGVGGGGGCHPPPPPQCC